MEDHIENLSQILDTPVSDLYMLSNDENSYARHRKSNYYRNYHKVILKRERSSKIRVLSVPNKYLRSVQRKILERILYEFPVSEHAMAYVKGRSLRDNAMLHTGKDVIVKLDIKHFFDSIDGAMVYRIFNKTGFSKPAVVLLTELCIYQNKLPQGAPTSPYIANLVLKDFDIETGKWCAERGITYSRYCDDMTFSCAKENMCSEELIRFIRNKLYYKGFSLNEKKTAVVSSSQQQRVTGSVVNQKPEVPKTLRRSIRQEVYYCRKFGLKDHVARKYPELSPETYLHKLLGKISYALQINPENTEMRACFETLSVLRKALNEAK